MTHQSEFAPSPEPIDETEAAESLAAESPDHAAAIDRAFDQESGEKFQAAREEKELGRVVSVAGSQVIVLLKRSTGESQLEPIELQIGRSRSAQRAPPRSERRAECPCRPGRK